MNIIRLANRAGLALVAMPVTVMALPFAPPIRYATGHVPEAIALGDLDRDGILDAVIANTYASTDIVAGDVSVFLGTASDGFRSNGQWPVGDRPEGLLLADIDRDEVLDVVTANIDASSITARLGDGSGGFGSRMTMRARGGPRSVVVMDLDDDGVLDLATADYFADTVTIWRGMGDGRFLPVDTLAAGDGPEVIATAHVDGDSPIDLVTVNARGDSVSIFLGLGNGMGFRARPAHEVGDAPRFVLARDLDGDGLDDLIVANHLSGWVSVEKNVSGERFETVGRLMVDGLGAPIYMDATDMDSDERMDLIVSWFHGDAFTVFPGAGGFEFGSPEIVPTVMKPVGIAAADFDRDGDVDVLVTGSFEDAVQLHASALEGGSGTIFRRSDANADGDVNLSDVIYVLMYLYGGGAKPSCMKSADMDDSGALDLSDPMRLLNHFVRGGLPPPPPFETCGRDETPDGLDCAGHEPCA
jgi:hypothetical protein